MSLITFNQAVDALEGADQIIIEDKNTGDRVVADYVGWEDAEGDDKADFVIGADGWDDVYIPHGEKIVKEGNVIKPEGCCVVLKLYREIE